MFKRLAEPTNIAKLVVSYIKGVLFAAVLFLSLLMANTLQVLSLVIYPFSKKLFRTVNCAGISQAWFGLMSFMLQRVYRIKFVMTGDDPAPKENVILLGNHQEMSDIPALSPLAARQKSLGNLKWFAKDPLKYVPGPGWGMRFVGCVFLKRDWNKDKTSIERTFSNIKTNNIPAWLIMFLEGTRVTAEKLSSSQRFAERRGLPIPQYVMIPRTKGFVATVQGLRDHLHAVYDVTIGYPEGIPTIQQMARGLLSEVHLHIRRYPVSSLPREDADLNQWVLQLYREKDELMIHFAEHKRFPGPILQPK